FPKTGDTSGSITKLNSSRTTPTVFPLSECVNAANCRASPSAPTAGPSPDVESKGSDPWISSNTNAQSSTVRQMGPTLSSVQLKAIAPYRLTRPYVGRSPTTAFVAAGEMIEPRVSVPTLNPTRPAAVAEAGPADEPLLERVRSQGQRVVPPNHRAPLASSPDASFPIRTAPDSWSLRTTVAS